MASAFAAPVPPITEPRRDPPSTAAEPEPRKWRNFAVPITVLALAVVVLFTVMHNWNAWQGGRIAQETNDAFVRGDLTPLGTKLSGVVRDVNVADYQQVHKGDVLVQLEDEDYK